MSRRFRITLLIACIVPVVLIAVLMGIFFALRYEPEFYRDALAIQTDLQEKYSDQMLQRIAAVVSDAKKPGKWQALFTAQQINGWLAVDFVNNHPKTLPPYLRDPRVAIKSDRIILACRCQWRFVSTVLTLTVVPYVPGENVLALRIIKARAGLVPMPLGKVLDGISEAAHKSDMRIEWRQSGGNPVALLYTPPPDNAGDLSVKIENIGLGKDEISVSGSTERKK